MNVSLGDHQRFEPEEFWKWPTTIVMLLTSQFPGLFSWSTLDYGKKLICRNILHSWNFSSVFGCLMSVFLNSILKNRWVTQTIATCLCSWTDTNSCVEPTCWFEDQLIYVCSHDRVLTSSRQTLPHYSAVMKHDMMQSPHMWSKHPQGLAGRMMVVEISDLRNLEEWWLFWPVFWRRLSG